MSDKKTDNQESNLVIEGPDQQLKINKNDLTFVKVHSHEHHYLPDFDDETDVYIALVCGKPGCMHGRLQKKDSKALTDWLDTHRAKR